MARPPGWLVPHVTRKADMSAVLGVFAAEHPVLAPTPIAHPDAVVTVLGTGNGHRLSPREQSDLAFIGYTLGAARLRARIGVTDGFDTNFERGLELGGKTTVIDIGHVAIAADDAAFVRFADAFGEAVDPAFGEMPARLRTSARSDLAQVLARDGYPPSLLLIYIADEGDGRIDGPARFPTYLWRCLAGLGRKAFPHVNLRTQRDAALGAVVSIANAARAKVGKTALPGDWSPDHPHYQSQIEAAMLIGTLRSDPSTSTMPIRWLDTAGKDAVPIAREGKVVAFKLVDSNEIVFVDERQTNDRPIPISTTSYHLDRNADGVLEAYRKLKM